MVFPGPCAGSVCRATRRSYATARLVQFAEVLRPCCTRPQWRYFVTVLLALVQCEERRTLSGLLRQVAEPVSLSVRSRFLACSPWSPAALARVWLARFQEQLAPQVQAEHARPRRRGRPRATQVTGYLALDDSTHHKPRGKRMGGLGRHYSGTEGRQVPGHSLFGGVYLLLGRIGPLAPQRYCQRQTCVRAGRPFRSAVAAIEQFTPAPHTATHVLVDSWYLCGRVWRAALRRGWDISGGMGRSARCGTSPAAWAATTRRNWCRCWRSAGRWRSGSRT
ncbi:MAG: transposase [Chloroflexi bacterium]|nr:transposase [Chloroflexota bacterium]